MSRFKDVYLSSRIQGYPVTVSPIFSTQITEVDSGDEQANQRWQDPLREITIPSGVRDQATFEAIKRHWLTMSGPAKTWPWRDPTDFASVDLTRINEVPTTSALDQSLGTGDGTTTEFQLTKTYAVGGSPAVETYERPIYYPVVSTIRIAINGSDPPAESPASGFTVTREGGKVVFDTAPSDGAVLTWGGLFDIPVRFLDDESFSSIMRTYNAAGFADIDLREVRFCAD